MFVCNTQEFLRVLLALAAFIDLQFDTIVPWAFAIEVHFRFVVVASNRYVLHFVVAAGTVGVIFILVIVCIAG